MDHIVAQDVIRGIESLDIPRIPNLDLELRRDSAPGGSSSSQGFCNHLPTIHPNIEVVISGLMLDGIYIDDI